jgi:hypothetical protein
MQLDRAELARVMADPVLGLASRGKIEGKLRRQGYVVDAAARKVLDAHFRESEVAQMTRPPRRHDTGFLLQSDTIGTYQVDVIKFAGQAQGGVGRALVAVDMHSRKMFAVPLKAETAAALLDALRVANREAGGDIKEIRADDQFSARGFADDLEEQDGVDVITGVAKHDHVGAGDRLGIVDRAARTLKALVTRQRLTSGARRLTPALLAQLVANYNSTPHRRLSGLTPDEVHTPQLRFAVQLHAAIVNQMRRESMEKSGKRPFQVGDTVRVLRPRGAFDKEGPSYSKRVYRIAGRDGVLTNSFRLVDKDTAEGAPRLYKSSELQRVHA